MRLVTSDTIPRYSPEKSYTHLSNVYFTLKPPEANSLPLNTTPSRADGDTSLRHPLYKQHKRDLFLCHPRGDSFVATRAIRPGA